MLPFKLKLSDKNAPTAYVNPLRMTYVMEAPGGTTIFFADRAHQPLR